MERKEGCLLNQPLWIQEHIYCEETGGVEYDRENRAQVIRRRLGSFVVDMGDTTESTRGMIAGLRSV
jgi:hypothetical protein